MSSWQAWHQVEVHDKIVFSLRIKKSSSFPTFIKINTKEHGIIDKDYYVLKQRASKNMLIVSIGTKIITYIQK